MTQTQRDQLTQLVNQLLQAPSCCAEAKAAGQAWLDAAGTDGEPAATQLSGRGPGVWRGTGQSHGGPRQRNPGRRGQVL